MAILNPSMEVILRQKVKPTAGEWTLLKFLCEILDDTYEIYFQPYLNGDNPDFVLMRKNSGVLIIEVKDWNLRHYVIDEKTKWRLSDGTKIKSPLYQVESYKDNLFNLHIEELFERNIKEKNNWAVVNCMVYFHHTTERALHDFLLQNFQGQEYKKYRNFINHVGLWGSDSLTATNIDTLFSKLWLNRQSYYFDDFLYTRIKRYLMAPIHQEEDGIEIIYTKEQQELIRSEIKPRRKIKGIAGSGKTLVLVKRAVNAHIRTQSKVLILTYNLSLKNYIHDRINDVRQEFDWRNFYITNYHQFFKTQANNYNVEIEDLSAWQNDSFFERVKDEIQKFDVVLIDEIQDYHQDWINIISKYFVHEETEFLVFGDEKQNIYEREMDDNKEPIVRMIPGRWNKSLNVSHRFSGNIGIIATKFQKTIFGQKYSFDEINSMSEIDYEKKIVKYYFIKKYTSLDLFEIIYDILEKNTIHPSDTAILGSKVELLRELDFHIRNIKHENTTTTFESKEEYEKLKETELTKADNDQVSNDRINRNIHDAIATKLESIRKVKKNHFWMKTGTLKLSTVHSFKGWEINTLFLLIENENISTENAELIYTGLTRARKNLVILNLGNSQYDEFFRQIIINE